jgi:hypothetical protein
MRPDLSGFGFYGHADSFRSGLKLGVKFVVNDEGLNLGGVS